MKRNRSCMKMKRKALKTMNAAAYVDVSPSLLRKMRRRRSPDDGQRPGPRYIRISRTLILYEIADLDSWLASFAELGDQGEASSLPAVEQPKPPISK